ncbi:hypothetical protein BABINDRAFT_161925 [Babjeviella inositovora NRRL Y-12698]|uniref:Uncharacterized protein n=1 Tax=Babjeviella inositovora NRRL Y-12698 TaxID=984486 RepID=A0A1E3QPB0_9ASCO|nr:uncharacterized protein BABINDRAFT_161925 [Babjeviella inositovora NRRL Y-12698]ODQ79533.1 hypothetical protein BABINDRAFT_161925 [Babjeviella inositovora NRRL Y-12698]
MSTTNTVSNSPKILQLLKPLVTNIQFYWFLGHVATVTFSVLHSLTSLFKAAYSPTPLRFYRWALVAIIFSYLIVLRQSYKNKKSLPFQLLVNRDFLLHDFLKNDNVQYLLFALSLLLFTTNANPNRGPIPLQGALYSFTIFSTFHALNYFNNNLNKSNARLLDWIKNFQAQFSEKSHYICATAEAMILLQMITIVPRTLILLVFRWQVLNAAKHLIVVLSYVVFIKLRYEQNAVTKTVIDGYVLKVDTLLSAPQLAVIPVQVKNFWFVTVKGLVRKYIGPIRLPQSKPGKKEM